MISAKEASTIVNTYLGDFGTEKIHISTSINRVLAEKIYADRDFPPFDRVMMDGIAINSNAWNESNRHYTIEDTQYAGDPVKQLNNPSNCIEVMTGAILPVNTDSVIRYEDLTIEEGTAKITLDILKEGQNVHVKGKDKRVGDCVVSKGTMLSPAEIAILASVGKDEVLVTKMPSVAVISTGDELVEINEVPADHQIRKSNVYALQASLLEIGIEAHLHHIVDQPSVMKEKIEKLLIENDVLLFSGGVSKGKKDYMPEVLESLGVQKHFHRVKQRPGKPFWFGTTEIDKTVFAFPGNPVSTYMCFYKYFIPWLSASMGIPYHQDKAILTEDFKFQPDLTYFLQVATSNENGKIVAKPVTGQGSGDFANLNLVDAFLEIPPDRSEFKAGEALPLIRYRGTYSK